MRDNEERDQWEERIVEASNQIDNMQPDWFTSTEWDLFIDAWYNLVHYYEEHADTVIGVEAVREYHHIMRLFRRTLWDERLSLDIHRQIEDKIAELEGVMDEIIKEAVTNKFN